MESKQRKEKGKAMKVKEGKERKGRGKGRKAKDGRKGKEINGKRTQEKER